MTASPLVAPTQPRAAQSQPTPQTRLTPRPLVATPPSRRLVTSVVQPVASLHHNARSTTTMHATFNTNTQPTFVSLPDASPCTTTNGQHRYASQCTMRH